MSGVTGFSAATIKSMLQDGSEPAIKKFFVSDTDGDPTDIYYAQANASGGEACLRQRLAYHEVVSGVKTIQKEAWEAGVWSGAAWDIV